MSASAGVGPGPPSAPADLFDLNSPSHSADSAPPERNDDQVWSLPWPQMTGVAVATAVVAVLFSFPPWALFGLPLAAVASQTLRSRRLLRRVAWVAVSSAFAAQMTDVFATPFDWTLRFVFFSVLFATAVLFWGWRMDEFDEPADPRPRP